MIRKIAVTVTVDAGGDGTGQTARPVSGRVAALHVAPNASCDVDVVASDPDLELLSVTSVSAATWYHPRGEAAGTDGGALTYDATEPVPVELPVDGYVDVTVANGTAGDVVVTLLVDED